MSTISTENASIFKLYKSIDTHLQVDEKPSIFLNEIYDSPIFLQYPFKMLHRLRETNQSPKHHPEGNVWKHTALVVDEAAKIKKNSKNPKALMWSALLHDIGKPDTTVVRKNKITSYDHDKVGAKLANEFLSVFSNDEKFIKDVTSLVRYHMQILFVVNNMSFADIAGMKKNGDVSEISLLGLSDRLGRKNVDIKKEEANISIFLKKCNHAICNEKNV